MEKSKASYRVGQNVNWCSHYGKQFGGFLKKKNKEQKLEIELPYDPVIALLSIYLDKTIIQKDIYTPLFIAAILNRSNLDVQGRKNVM